jgi:hypothetical protein
MSESFFVQARQTAAGSYRSFVGDAKYLQPVGSRQILHHHAGGLCRSKRLFETKSIRRVCYVDFIRGEEYKQVMVEIMSGGNK